VCHIVDCHLLQSVHWLQLHHTVEYVHCLSITHTVPYVHCCLLHSVHCLTVPANVLHTVESVHCLSVTHTVPMSTAVFYIPSTACQYLTLFRLLALCPLFSSWFCPLFDSATQCTVCFFCVTISTALVYTLFNACQYLTRHSRSTVCQKLILKLLLDLRHYMHCCLLISAHNLLISHTVPSLGSVSLCPLLSSRVLYCQSVRYTLPSLGSVTLCTLWVPKICPRSVNTSQLIVRCYCVSMSNAVFYSVSKVCKYLTPYRSSFLCRYIH